MTQSARKIAVWTALVLLMICFSLPADCQDVIALVGSGSNLPHAALLPLDRRI